jgi:hypothetical protein
LKVKKAYDTAGMKGGGRIQTGLSGQHKENDAAKLDNGL